MYYLILLNNQGLIKNVTFIYFIGYVFMFTKEEDFDILLNTLLQYRILMYSLSLFYL